MITSTTLGVGAGMLVSLAVFTVIFCRKLRGLDGKSNQRRRNSSGCDYTGFDGGCDGGDGGGGGE